jgi:hypothetical protein
VALTADEKAELKTWVLGKSCEEYRRCDPCVKRKPTTRMIGDMHEGCYWVGHILQLVEAA